MSKIEFMEWVTAAAVVALYLGVLIAWAGAVYVALHFITKYW